MTSTILNKESSTGVRLKMPVAKVTLFEDRAEVVRRGRIPAPGPHDVVILDVSPLTAPDRTKVVAKNARTGERVLVDDVQIVHEWAEEIDASQTQTNEVFAVVEEKRRITEDLKAQLGFAERSRAAKLDAFDAWQARTGEVAFLHPVDKSVWQQGSRSLEAAVLEKEETIKALSLKLRDAYQELHDVEELISRRHVAKRRLVAHIVLRLSHATEEVDLEISSRLPCALWRPTHEAHLLPQASTSPAPVANNPFDEQMPTSPGVPDNVDFASIDFSSAENDALAVEWNVQAAIWQHTGEDWNDVELFLSTERPSKGALLPQLHEDRLRVRLKSSEERRTIQVEHRTEVATPQVSTGVVPGVYDGGEARHFKVPQPVSLKSDGTPRQIRVKSFTAAVHVDRVAFPDQSARVFRRAKLENPLEIPLLAGPVSLREVGAFIGVGDLRYVGPLEKFALSFGTDDGLVVRTRRFQSVESRRIAKDRTHYVTEVTLLSARARPTNVDVMLRWPVSELEQVKVEASPEVTTGGTPIPDADGLVHVPLTVPASGRKMVQLGFSFDVTGNVNLPPPW